MGRIKPNWTSLPEHLLSFIAKRLDTEIDILRLRAVCRSFRSMLPPPPKLFPFPQSVLRSNDFLKGPNPKSDDLFVLVKSTVYAIQPLNKISNKKDDISEPWLLYVEECEPGDRLQIISPLFPNRFKNLTEFPKSLNLLDYCVSEISKSFALASPGFRKDKPLGMQLFDCFPDFEVIFTTCLDESDDEFAVMARIRNKLRVWRNVDRKWSNIEMIVLSDYIENIIFHNHKFYAVIRGGRTLALDSKSLTVTEAVASQQNPVIDTDVALEYVMATLKDDLFLIVRYADCDDHRDYMKIFRLDEKKCQWVPVVKPTDFEDLSFVMSTEDGFIYSVSARDFSESRGQSFYIILNNSRFGYEDDVALTYELNFGIIGPFVSLNQLYY